MIELFFFLFLSISCIFEDVFYKINFNIVEFTLLLPFEKSVLNHLCLKAKVKKNRVFDLLSFIVKKLYKKVFLFMKHLFHNNLFLKVILDKKNYEITYFLSRIQN